MTAMHQQYKLEAIHLIFGIWQAAKKVARNPGINLRTLYRSNNMSFFI
jgi:hypothetical protein